MPLWLKGVLPHVAIGAAMLLLVYGLDRCAHYAMSSMQESATQAGEQKARADHYQEAIRQTEKADAAADEVRRNGGPARDDCLRDSRTPENC